uniref:Uncharacterized protein n=1 Tax=Caenorhabditis japonica TaxID=281687 RepID=A0A8R1IVS3_CAEJA
MQHGVIRGCVDRLLLFGLDDDVRNVLSAYDNQRVCRHTDRKLLRLFPLSERTDVSDESKFMLFGSDGISYVRRPVGTRFNPKYQTPFVKHDGDNVMVWSCFSSHEVGPLHRIRGNMDRFVYEQILQNVMLPFARVFPKVRYLFQQDNDPKHKSNHIIVSEMSQTIGSPPTV